MGSKGDPDLDWRNMVVAAHMPTKIDESSGRLLKKCSGCNRWIEQALVYLKGVAG